MVKSSVSVTLVLTSLLCIIIRHSAAFLVTESKLAPSPALCSALRNSKKDGEYPVKVSDEEVRFLGIGKNAIVRPGVVMLAPSHEFHHFYRHAAIFVHAMGLDEDDTYVVRGVILDNPTPFTLGEMTDDINLQLADLCENLLFRGGGDGNDSALLLHNQPNIGNGAMIGTSGIYQGGLEDACKLENQKEDLLKKDSDFFRKNFKFFFNYCEFTEAQLESMFDEDVDSQGDAWISVEVPPDIVLADWDKGKAWARLRNAVVHHWKK